LKLRLSSSVSHEYLTWFKVVAEHDSRSRERNEREWMLEVDSDGELLTGLLEMK
jgi:hypothetical protein